MSLAAVSHRLALGDFEMQHLRAAFGPQLFQRRCIGRCSAAGDHNVRAGPGEFHRAGEADAAAAAGDPRHFAVQAHADSLDNFNLLRLRLSAFAAAMQGRSNLRGRRPVRADRRLRTDKKHIRVQSTILYETPSPSWCYCNRVIRTDRFYPYR